MEAGGGVDFGNEIKQPLGIEIEALNKMRALFKTQFDNILSNINHPVKTSDFDYHPENIDLSDLDIFYVIL